MKIFGKQGDNYIVSIPKNELLQIVFGESYPTSSSVKNAREISEFQNKIDKEEVEVSASKVFKKMMDLHSTNLSESYHGLIAKIDALKGLITPIDDYIKSHAEDTKQ